MYVIMVVQDFGTARNNLKNGPSWKRKNWDASFGAALQLECSIHQ